VTTTEHTPPPSVNTAALRLARTPGDMLKAVLMILVPVALLFALYVFFFGGNNVITIDPSGTYAEARAASRFAVLQPVGLDSKYKPVSSAFDDGTPATLRVGYVAPDGAGMQLVETNQPADAFLKSELGALPATSRSVQAGPLTWGLVTNAKNVGTALVSTEGGRTVIVKGEASRAELTAFAASLH